MSDIRTIHLRETDTGKVLRRPPWPGGRRYVFDADDNRYGVEADQGGSARTGRVRTWLGRTVSEAFGDYVEAIAPGEGGDDA